MTWRRMVIKDLSCYGIGIVRSVKRRAVTANGETMSYQEFRALLYEKDPVKYGCMKTDYTASQEVN